MEQLMATSSGRYKAIKLIQYTTKAFLLQRPNLTQQHLHQLASLVGACSLQRRLLQLGNAYKPIKQLLLHVPRGKLNLHELLETIAALCEDASEDAFTLAQLGWLPAHFKSFAVISDRAWLASVALDLHLWIREKVTIMRQRRLNTLLHEKYAKTTERELVRQEYWHDLDGVRLACDFGQAWCDVFDVALFKGFDTYCGLMSSILGLYRFVAKT